MTAKPRIEHANVGSGGAAFAAAIAAQKESIAMIMVERDTVGGTRVNTGCVPSKGLLAAGGTRHSALDADRFPGLSWGVVGVDFSKLIAQRVSWCRRCGAKIYRCRGRVLVSGAN